MKPNERDPVIDRMTAGLEPPLPPPELRSRVLAAAHARMAGEPLTDVWSMLWNNRGVRVAWASAAVLLLAGHVLLIPGNGSASNRVAPALVAENRADEYLVYMLRPVQISADAQPIIGLFANANGLIELDLEGNPS